MPNVGQKKNDYNLRDLVEGQFKPVEQEMVCQEKGPCKGNRFREKCKLEQVPRVLVIQLGRYSFGGEEKRHEAVHVNQQIFLPFDENQKSNTTSPSVPASPTRKRPDPGNSSPRSNSKPGSPVSRQGEVTPTKGVPSMGGTVSSAQRTLFKSPSKDSQLGSDLNLSQERDLEQSLVQAKGGSEGNGNKSQGETTGGGEEGKERPGAAEGVPSKPPIDNGHDSGVESEHDSEAGTSDKENAPQNASPCLASQSLAGPRTMYGLRAIVCHHGSSLSGGHYISYILNPRDQQWYHCDDDAICQVELEKAQEDSKSSGYCFFYVKDNQPLNV
jgi:hypothetical protein